MLFSVTTSATLPVLLVSTCGLWGNTTSVYSYTFSQFLFRILSIGCSSVLSLNVNPLNGVLMWFSGPAFTIVLWKVSISQLRSILVSTILGLKIFCAPKNSKKIVFHEMQIDEKNFFPVNKLKTKKVMEKTMKRKSFNFIKKDNINRFLIVFNKTFKLCLTWSALLTVPHNIKGN